jgi:hypothetical protein
MAFWFSSVEFLLTAGASTNGGDVDGQQGASTNVGDVSG